MGAGRATPPLAAPPLWGWGGVERGIRGGGGIHLHVLLRGRGQMMAAMGMRRRSSSLTSVLVSARVGGRDEPGCLMMRGVVVVSLLAKASMHNLKIRIIQ